MWACPHCGAPQAEAARCWVCHRSSTTCSTCRHFRPSLAADVGYCGKDRWRTPLTGLELRACWEEGRRAAAGFGSIAPSSGAQPPVAGPALHLVQEPPQRAVSPVVVRGGGVLDRPDPMRLRGFVPLDELMERSVAEAEPSTSAREPSASAAGSSAAAGSASASSGAPPPEHWETRTSLFGEVER